MNLGFKTKWNSDMGPEFAGKPTYFPEKVLSSMIEELPDFDWDNFSDHIDNLPQPYECTLGDYDPKHHTLRPNRSGRIKSGVLLQPFIWSDKPYHSKPFYFAPKVKCISTQNVIILTEKVHGEPLIFIDDRILKYSEVDAFAKNDGFDSAEQFFKWFSNGFSGSLIHWTNLKY